MMFLEIFLSLLWFSYDIAFTRLRFSKNYLFFFIQFGKMCKNQKVDI